MKKVKAPRPVFKDEGDDNHCTYKSRKFTVRLQNSGMTTSHKVATLHTDGSFTTIDENARLMLMRTQEQWARLDGSPYIGPLLPYNPRKVKLILAPKPSPYLVQSIEQTCGRECLFTVTMQYREFEGKTGPVKAILLLCTGLKAL